MTFYLKEERNILPDLPTLGFILDESPYCIQNLNFWEERTEEIGSVINHVANCANIYRTTALAFSTASENLTLGMQRVAKVFSKDDNLKTPLIKFTDMLQRVDCYHGMFLNQTEMLLCNQLETLSKEFEKVKEMKQQVAKARHDLTISWEKFSNCQNINTLPESSVLDKLAFNLFTSRHHYHMLLSTYINSLREMNSVKKISFVKTMVEHILAKYFFINFSYQIFKESEEYTNVFFDNLLNRVVHSEIQCENDARLKKLVQLKIDRALEKDKGAFHEPVTFLGSTTLAQSVTTVNTQAGKFFNRINGLLGNSGLREPSIKRGQNVTLEASPTRVNGAQEDQLEDVRNGEKKEPEDIKSNTSNENIEQNQTSTAKTEKEEISTWSEFKSAETEKSVNNECKSNKLANNELLLQNTPSNTAEIDNELNEKSFTDNVEKDLSDIVPVSKWPNYHRGYLRLRQRSFPKNKWPLLYFIVDEASGKLLVQGKDEKEPNEFANLLLSNVKTCDELEIDRNFCFQLTSPKSEQILQALTENDMHQWIAAIQAATTEAFKKSKEKLQSLQPTYAYGYVKPEDDKQYATNASERIRKVQGNKTCVDCTHPRPDWASINIGIVMCIECSGVHRSLGVHISKVRSLTLDKWEEKVVKFMESRGNTLVNEIYEYNMDGYRKPSRDSNKDERIQFIRLKYAEKKFVRSENDNSDTKVELDKSEELLESENCLEEGNLLEDGNLEECSIVSSGDSENQSFSKSQLQMNEDN
ncbi:ADP-ribosylation factor GTPase-activating protein AGD2-like [Xenia sp. Carnegie-2017]|uniref:ADP-ribosylation factor GTPase-activating protein AGD2-like n=1 Tax=Xenia sp. Carnegie-2017 TaxID=2897299 RepID=UPI001F04A9D5|nr:ADP-ribosylation factor GTPase-activating protein AGD2-like [Xenia sp. Carnegie-2017]